MRAFIDTSALFKKYVQEKGSDQFDQLLRTVTDIIVAPTTWLEIVSVIERRLLDKDLSVNDAKQIKEQVKIDFNYFHKIVWSETFDQKGEKVIAKYNLRTLDSIQLVSGMLADCDIFVTSDQKLSAAARKEIRKVKFIK